MSYKLTFLKDLKTFLRSSFRHGCWFGPASQSMYPKYLHFYYPCFGTVEFLARISILNLPMTLQMLCRKMTEGGEVNGREAVSLII